jgi:hypothetical protein
MKGFLLLILLLFHTFVSLSLSFSGEEKTRGEEKKRGVRGSGGGGMNEKNGS